jgi:hypothetical protein
MAFREDKSHIRKEQAPGNFAVLRHITLNLLKQEKTAKVGIKGLSMNSNICADPEGKASKKI